MRSIAALLLATAISARGQPPRSAGPESVSITHVDRYPRLGIEEFNGVADLSNVEITLRRTWQLMGAPPEYRLTLRGNGRGEYVGLAFVLVKGKHKIEYEPARLLALMDEFERLDFLNFEHSDNWTTRDVQAEIITLKIGTRSRRFENRWSGNPMREPSDLEFHSKLSDLASEIDAFASVGQWVGTEPERTAQSRR